MRHAERPRQADVDRAPARPSAASRGPPRAAPVDSPNRFSPRPPARAASTARRVGELRRPSSCELRVVEGRRGPDAVDRGRRDEHRQRRAGPDRRQPGRGAADRDASGGPGRASGVRRAIGPSAHRGRSAGVRRRPARGGVALEREVDDPDADGGERVAALGRHRREEADRGEARDRVDLGQVDRARRRRRKSTRAKPSAPIAR